MNRAVICDLDGTVCLRTDRDPYDMTRVSEDLPNEPVVRLLRMMHYGAYLDVVFVSARTYAAWKDSRDWLRRWALDCVDEHHLFMRGETDFRPDEEIKAEIYWNFIAERWDVDYVLDDRSSVVTMWREEAGLTCLQVADGKF